MSQFKSKKEEILSLINRIPSIPENQVIISTFEKDLSVYYECAEDDGKGNLLGFLEQRVKSFLRRSHENIHS